MTEQQVAKQQVTEEEKTVSTKQNFRCNKWKFRTNPRRACWIWIDYSFISCVNDVRLAI